MEDGEAVQMLKRMRDFIVANEDLPRQSRKRKRTEYAEQSLSRSMIDFTTYWRQGKAYNVLSVCDVKQKQVLMIALYRNNSMFQSTLINIKR